MQSVDASDINMIEDVIYIGEKKIQQIEQVDIDENPSMRCKLKVKIVNFSSEANRYVTKPFTPISCCTAQFTASLDVYEASVLEVSLKKTSRYEKPLHVTLKTSLTLFSTHLEECLKQTIQKTIFTFTDSDDRCVCFRGCLKFRLPGSSDKLSFPDVVEVNFGMKIKGLVPNTNVVIRMREPDSKSSWLAEAMVRAFLAQEHVDTLLCVGTESIGAHKVVLCARSIAFAKNLESEALGPGTEFILDLQEISFPTLKRLLIFMYTGFLDALDYKAVHDLHNAAEMCEMPDLKQKCEAKLKTFLSPAMITRLLKFTARNNDDVSRSSIEEYLRNHLPEVRNRDENKELSSKNPDLLADIMPVCL